MRCSGRARHGPTAAAANNYVNHRRVGDVSFPRPPTISSGKLGASAARPGGTYVSCSFLGERLVFGVLGLRCVLAGVSEEWRSSKFEIV
jgi:hypothetical protein